ncbi:MAG: trimeric autotransporter adhesin [Frankiaceae bacterium]|jgi:hypothetical protein|nr:trimeric autotransporter adhesin [Frankiaceae bacterium]
MRALRHSGAATLAGALAAGAVLAALPAGPAVAASFGSNDLVVYRVGTGAQPLTNAATAVFLDEFTATGTKVRSLTLPTVAKSGRHALTASGTSTSEGQLVRSPDGRFLTATGYDAAPGATATVDGGPASITASDPSAVGRTVAVVDGFGNVDTRTALTAPGTPSIVRSAVTTDGTHAWVAGGDGGLKYVTLGTTTARRLTPVTSNLETVAIAGKQLFVSQAGASGVAAVGTGQPRSGSPALVPLAGLPAGTLDGGFAFLDLTTASFAGTGLDTLYVANAASGDGAVEKYRWTGATWTASGSVAVEGVLGLVARKTGTTVSIAVSTPTSLATIVDASPTGTLKSAGPKVIASAPANTEFRGLALSPTTVRGVTVLTPTPGASVRLATLAVIARVVDTRTISAVSVRVDAGPWVLAKRRTDGLYGASVAVGKAGPHTITVRATDAASSFSSTATITRVAS